MKTLINNLYTILYNAVQAGIINAGNIKKTSVFKGYSDMPDRFVQGEGYITIDDGGERIEENISTKTNNHYYSVIIEVGIQILDRINALETSLDLWEQVRTILQLETSRQKDGMILPVDIAVDDMEQQDSVFYRIRTAKIDYVSIEDIYEQY